MKFTNLLLLSSAVSLLGACTLFDSRQPEAPPVVHTPKQLAVPVGKNWKVIEEPPKLSDERGRLPFQTEQSVQPDVAKPVVPEKSRVIETPR